MKVLRRIILVLKRTGAVKVLISFILFCILSSFLLLLFEPTINSFGDGLWYCFISSTTIGFGDFYATTIMGRIITIFVAFYGIFVFAMMTGVVVSYYMEYLSSKKEETISLFLEKLENLPKLSKKELEEISEQVKRRK